MSNPAKMRVFKTVIIATFICGLILVCAPWRDSAASVERAGASRVAQGTSDDQMRQAAFREQSDRENSSNNPADWLSNDVSDPSELGQVATQQKDGEQEPNVEERAVAARVDVAGLGKTLRERVGTDDGAAFIIDFSGDMHGNLDSCGCKGRLVGGLGRRVNYVNELNSVLKGIPNILVDSGFFLNDDAGAHGSLKGDASLRDDWVLKAYDQFPVALANVSIHELPYLSRFMGQQDPAPDIPPILKRLVSANIQPERPGSLELHPFLVREFPGRSAGSKPTRVAFVGLSELAPKPVPGFKIADPIETARKVIPEARRQSDAVVVLAHVPMEIAARIAHEVTGIDVIVCGTGALFTPPLTLGSTLIAFTAHETRMLGELRFFKDAAGKLTVKDRFISLDGQLGDDPVALKLINDTTAARKKAFATFTAQNMHVPQIETAYASATTCAKCHLEQFMRWQNSAHSRAMSSLAPKAAELDSGCLACHTTGFGKGGFAGSETRSLVNVQCEQCHGPAKDHLLKPDKSYGKIANPRALCIQCHTEETSAGFNFEAYWGKVKH